MFEIKKVRLCSGLPVGGKLNIRGGLVIAKYLAVCAVLLAVVSGVSFSKSKSAQIKIKVTLNNPPYVPQIVSPADDAEVAGKNIVFKWKFSDPDPGQEQKFFFIDLDSKNDFKSVKFTSEITKSSKGQWKCKAAIPAGKWYWRVRASDGYEWSKFSKIGSFSVIKQGDK